jgi:hypothetical protein
LLGVRSGRTAAFDHHRLALADFGEQFLVGEVAVALDAERANRTASSLRERATALISSGLPASRLAG